MSRPECDDLIQGGLDGMNTPGDSARLEELIGTRPDLGARLARLRQVSEGLQKVERLDPPPDLADEVMAAVRRRKAGVPARPGWLQALRALLAPAPLAACAATLVLGIALGAMVHPDAARLSRSETSALSGTALSRGRIDRSGILDRRTFQDEGIRGEAATRVEDGLLVADLLLDATRQAVISVELEGTGLSPVGFTRDTSSGGEVTLSRQRVRFAHEAGRCRYTLSFSPGETGAKPLRVREAASGGDRGDRDLVALAVRREGS